MPTTIQPQLFFEQLKKLSPVELRFVVEALHDGAQLAEHEARVYPEDVEPCMARKRVLDELWNRLANDINRQALCQD